MTGINLTEEEIETIALRAADTLRSSGDKRHSLVISLHTHKIVGLHLIVHRFQLLGSQLLVLDMHKDIFRLIIPVHSAVATSLPEQSLSHHIGQPLEMLGDIKESRCATHEVAAEELSLAHHHPSIMEKRVKLLTLAIFFIFCRIAALLGFLLDGV